MRAMMTRLIHMRSSGCQKFACFNDQLIVARLLIVAARRRISHLRFSVPFVILRLLSSRALVCVACRRLSSLAAGKLGVFEG